MKNYNFKVVEYTNKDKVYFADIIVTEKKSKARKANVNIVVNPSCNNELSEMQCEYLNSLSVKAVRIAVKELEKLTGHIKFTSLLNELNTLYRNDIQGAIEHLDNNSILTSSTELKKHTKKKKKIGKIEKLVEVEPYYTIELTDYFKDYETIIDEKTKFNNFECLDLIQVAFTEYLNLFRQGLLLSFDDCNFNMLKIVKAVHKYINNQRAVKVEFEKDGTIKHGTTKTIYTRQSFNDCNLNKIELTDSQTALLSILKDSLKRNANKDEYTKIFILKYCYEFTEVEIAKLLNCTKGNINQKTQKIKAIMLDKKTDIKALLLDI